MLWQPVVIKHPEDLQHGRELWLNMDVHPDICACGHDAKFHSRVATVWPEFIDGEFIGFGRIGLVWFACRDLTHPDGYFCMCPGFWKAS